ncbi:MAG: RNA recognition motif domain-containing protein [Desulfobaccales bacterium]
MSKRLSVGNLPQQMTGEELQTLFSEAGLVASSKIITYLHNGETRGFGFVEMKTQEESQRAIALLNGRQIYGQLLIVKADSTRSRSAFSRRRK